MRDRHLQRPQVGLTLEAGDQELSEAQPKDVPKPTGAAAKDEAGQKGGAKEEV